MSKMRSLSALFAGVIAAAPVLAEEVSSVSGNITLASEYFYRGLTQTDHKPALQAGVDWDGGNGWYLGLWGSNISWLSDAAPGSSSSVEIDVYGGKKFSAGDVELDVGVLQYLYPGKYSAAWKAASGLESPHTTEVYLGGSYGIASAKVSVSLSDLFGAPDSKGSQYYEFALEPKLSDTVTLVAHVGRQVVRGAGNGDYTDWKLGVSTEIGGFEVGLFYVDTNVSSGRALLTLGKSF